MTFDAILADLYRRLRYSATPPTDVTTRLSAFIQDRYREVLTMPGMEEFRQALTSLTTVPGKHTYGLPPSVARILAITQRTNQMPLREVSLKEIRDIDPSLTQHGSCAELFCHMGHQPVESHPSQPSSLWVKSTDATDITQILAFQGLRQGGFPHSVTVAIQGIIAVDVAPVELITDWMTVTQFALSSLAKGTVTLHEGSGTGPELARIGPGEIDSRYLSILLWPIPSGETYHIDYERHLLFDQFAGDLTAGSVWFAAVEPALPADFHRLIRIGAQADEYEYLDDPRQSIQEQKYQAGIRQLKAWLHTRPTLAPVPYGRARRSQLGPHFAAGT